jgi:hypothetical protein
MKKEAPAETPLQSQDSQYTHILLHNDLSALQPGALTEASHPFKLPNETSFRVIERGTGKYIESVGGGHGSDRMLMTGDPLWRDYRVRAVVTPLSFDEAGPSGGLCGIVARYASSQNYISLVLDRDGHVKLLHRNGNTFEVLDSKQTEYCLGQSLTLTLRVEGDLIRGTAGPYSGATQVEGRAFSGGDIGGAMGLIADVPARFGPFTIECSQAEAARIADATSKTAANNATKRKAVPKMRLERTIPLHGLVNGPNLRIADINGDGKPEIILAQSSPSVASAYSITRLTCLSVLDLDGKLLWQAGVADPKAPRIHDDLPFQAHDLFGDGGIVVVCAIGYDIQIRDGKSGKLLFSASTPETATIGSDFKEVASSYGKSWGDETLNMDVSWLGFCNTQGNSGAREIILKDDHHHLAVLDAGLQTLFRHRGNHGHVPWIGDLDGDGRAEIFAGYSLLNGDGKHVWSAAIGPYPRAVTVLDPLNPGGNQKRVFFASGAAGLFAFNTGRLPKPEDALIPSGRVPASRLSIAKFRADLPGIQLATVSDTGTFALYDASGKQLWVREFFSPSNLGLPVNWTGRGEEFLLTSTGLIDGRGDALVEFPAPLTAPWADTSSVLSSDGRDSILTWDEQTLNVYVPDNAPLSGDAYKPLRPGNENSSVHRARVSLPPK